MTADTAKAAQTVQKTPTDIAILVMPTAPDEARIGLVYRTRLSHRQVREEIQRLRDSGWQIVPPIAIEDSSVHPEQRDRFPLTTGAEFTVRNATRIAEAFPALAPCLHAFQRWNSLELIVGVNGNTALAAQMQLNGPDLSITQVNGDGVIRFETVIHKHSGTISIPTPLRTSEPQSVSHPIPVLHPAASGDALQRPMLLALLGIVLFGVGLFLLTRRNGRVPAARTSHR